MITYSSTEESVCDDIANSNSKKKLCSVNLKEDASFIDSSSLTSEIEDINNLYENESDITKDVPTEFGIEDHRQNENDLIGNVSEDICIDNEPPASSIEISIPENNFTADEIVEPIPSSSSSHAKQENKSIFSGKNLESDLRKWAVASRTPHTKLRSLLSMLRLYDLVLPIDPRTLLKTPRDTQVKKCKYGEYKHFGLIESVNNILNKNIDFTLPHILNLGIGIDDLPTYKGISITVILGCIDEIGEVFIIGMTSLLLKVEP